MLHATLKVGLNTTLPFLHKRFYFTTILALLCAYSFKMPIFAYKSTQNILCYD